MSIVWCALNSFAAVCYYFVVVKHPSTFVPEFLRLVVGTFIISELYGIALIIYYAVTSPAITTVAHICALLLGALIGAVFCLKFATFKTRSRQNSFDTSQESTLLQQRREYLDQASGTVL